MGSPSDSRRQGLILKKITALPSKPRAKPLTKPPASRKVGVKPKVALALAGGGPLGAMYEIGVLMALDESIEGLKLNDMDVYVGVSAGSFITAALANQLTPAEIYRLFIDNKAADKKTGALLPALFLKPAYGEFFRRSKSLPPLLLKAVLPGWCFKHQIPKIWCFFKALGVFFSGLVFFPNLVFYWCFLRNFQILGTFLTFGPFLGLFQC